MSLSSSFSRMLTMVLNCCSEVPQPQFSSRLLEGDGRRDAAKKWGQQAKLRHSPMMPGNLRTRPHCAA